jgi:hypothetical protein
MIYKGILEIDEYGCLNCGDSYLVEDVEAHFKKGDNVFIRYYVTDKEVTEEEAKEALILKTIGGNVDELEFVLDAYSEYTIMELEEHLVVGGHDLFNELQDCEGKFLTLIVEAVS